MQITSFFRIAVISYLYFISVDWKTSRFSEGDETWIRTEIKTFARPAWNRGWSESSNKYAETKTWADGDGGDMFNKWFECLDNYCIYFFYDHYDCMIYS